MNDTATSQPGASLLPDATGAITTIHLVLLLLIALAAVAIIVVGVRRKRLRDEATRQVVRHAEEAGTEPPSVAVKPAPAPSPPAPPPPVPSPSAPPPPPPPAPTPVAVAPPPRADDPVADTPAPDRLADEPVAAAAPLAASPATIAADPAPASAPPSSESLGNGPVTQLKGLGPKVAARLAELGVTSIGQIAALDADAAAALDAQLGAFAGRMARDRWVEQARFLTAGDRAGFEAAFGRL